MQLYTHIMNDNAHVDPLHKRHIALSISMENKVRKKIVIDIAKMLFPDTKIYSSYGLDQHVYAVIRKMCAHLSLTSKALQQAMKLECSTIHDASTG